MKRILLVVLILACAAVLSSVGTLAYQTLFAGCHYLPGSLVGKSMAEIQSAAQEYLCTTSEYQGKPPVVRLNRMISAREYMSFQGANSSLCQDQQLAYVVFEGDFDSVGIFSSALNPIRAKFVGLLLDLETGLPIGVNASATGEGFREILNDASLPERRTVSSPAPETLPDCVEGILQPTVMPHK